MTKLEAIGVLVETVIFHLSEIPSNLHHRGGQGGRWYVKHLDLVQLRCLDAVARLLSDEQPGMTGYCDICGAPIANDRENRFLLSCDGPGNPHVLGPRDR